MSEAKALESAEDELARIEAEVSLKRREFTNSFSELKERVEDLGDWRAWVGARPLTFVMGAAVVGWALGRAVRFSR